MALITQIKDIVNDAVADALGNNANLTQLDSSDIVSMGKQIAQLNLYEGFYKSLVNRIARTVYFVRSYSGKDRSVMRDEHEYGAFIQKVYYKMPEAVDNPTYNYQAEDPYAFQQVSPYDIQTPVAISAKVFGGRGTWSIEIMRPVEQMKSAFLSESEMLAFIDGIYTQIENAFQYQMEQVTALAVNTAMASALSGGKSRNLLAEYNAAHPDGVLTVAQALESADFFKYASKEISLTIENMGRMSTVFNKNGYETFTSKDNLVVEMLTQFAKSANVYLNADTFHDELVALPNFESVPYWQGSGNNPSFAFETASAINIKHDDFVTEQNENGTVNQTGIIAFLHDKENVAAYFGRRYSWELFNPRSDVINHGEKAEYGYAVDDNANAIVFYMA